MFGFPPSDLIAAVCPPTLEKIMHEVYEFEGRTGKKPKNLYLGRDEDKCLGEYLSPWPKIIPITYKIIRKSIRAKFHGMEIFVVDAENHVGVS